MANGGSCRRRRRRGLRPPPRCVTQAGPLGLVITAMTHEFLEVSEGHSVRALTPPRHLARAHAALANTARSKAPAVAHSPPPHIPAMRDPVALAVCAALFGAGHGGHAPTLSIRPRSRLLTS